MRRTSDLIVAMGETKGPKVLLAEAAVKKGTFGKVKLENRPNTVSQKSEH